MRLRRIAVHRHAQLRDGDAATTDGRGGGTGFRPQYSFELARVWDTDLALSNHWASTAPDSRFRRVRVVSIVLPHGFATLTDRQYRRRAGTEGSEAEITDPRVYRMRLSMMFGIDLSVERVAELGLF